MSPNPASGRVEQLAQAIAARVVNLVVEAIDINALMAKIDVEAIIERVDVEQHHRTGRRGRNRQARGRGRHRQARGHQRHRELQMDIDSLVEKTELGAIIARSTTGVFTEVLDVIRAQGVGLDDFCARWTNRVLRRRPGTLPAGPGMVPAAAPTAAPGSGDVVADGTRRAGKIADPVGFEGCRWSCPPSELTVERQGQYAGAVSRLAAFALDVGASWGIYVAASALLSFAVQLLSGHTYDVSRQHPSAAVSTLVIWEFAYFTYQWAVAGRTIGMAIFGVRVVRFDGGPVNGRAAVIRTLTLPLSIVVFFLGFLGILTNRRTAGVARPLRRHRRRLRMGRAPRACGGWPTAKHR